MSDFDGSYDDGCCEDDTGASAEAASYSDQVSAVLADVDTTLDAATDVAQDAPIADGFPVDTDGWLAPMDEPAPDPTPDPATDTGMWVAAMDDGAAPSTPPGFVDDATAGWVGAMDDPAASASPGFADDATAGWVGAMDAADASGPAAGFGTDPGGWLEGETGTVPVPLGGITVEPISGENAVTIGRPDLGATTEAPAGFTTALTPDGTVYVDGAGRTSRWPPPEADD